MNWLRKFLTENVALKLLALVLAVVIWTAVGGDIDTEILMPVPIEFRNVPTNLHYHAEPTRVDLRLRGPRWMVRQAVATDFTVPVDLTAMIEPGERIVDLDLKTVEGPGSIQVMDITPSQILLILSSTERP